MSSKPVIEVRDVGKCFDLYRRPVDRVKEIVLPSRPVLHDEFWALRNVSFTVQPSETLGIIGPNGSGKSTLLEIIAGTHNATEGEIFVNGRVAALLELGAGFNPEFSGRENIFMNASVMGLSRVETEGKYDDIVAFAELEDYIDRPVRTYSSGMYVRLAFATAVHMDPEILIVDEALAVGDIRFQRKCFRLFEEFKRAGKTILFVTHATESITTHCDRALFLNSGRLQEMGNPKDVVHSYLTFMFSADEQPRTDASADGSNSVNSIVTVDGAHRNEKDNKPQGRDYTALNANPDYDACKMRRHYNPTEYRWGDQRAKIIDFLVQSQGVFEPIVCAQGSIIEISISVCFTDALNDLIYGLTLKTVDGITVYGVNTRNRHLVVVDRGVDEVVTVRFRLQANLIPGDYFVSLGVAVDDRSVDNLAIDRRYDLFLLSIEGNRADFGMADLCAEIDELTDQANDVECLLVQGSNRQI